MVISKLRCSNYVIFETIANVNLEETKMNCSPDIYFQEFSVKMVLVPR